MLSKSAFTFLPEPQLGPNALLPLWLLSQRLSRPSQHVSLLAP
jgi:hypothetical protein